MRCEGGLSDKPRIWSISSWTWLYWTHLAALDLIHHQLTTQTYTEPAMGISWENWILVFAESIHQNNLRWIQFSSWWSMIMLAMLVYMCVHGLSNKYKRKQPRSSTTFCLQMSCGSANIYFYDLWIQIRRFQGEPFYGRDSLLDIKNFYCLFQCIISLLFHFVSFNLSLSQDQTPKSKCKL